MYVAIVGPKPFMPIEAYCEKQIGVSNSSTESEIVAAELAVRSAGLQVSTFWEHVTVIFTNQSVKPDTETALSLPKDPVFEHYNPLA